MIGGVAPVDLVKSCSSVSQNHESTAAGGITMASSPHPMIHAERRALIDDLNGVEPARWTTPSLCPDWTVHQALGHLVSAAKMTKPKFFKDFASTGFKFNKFAQKGVDAETRATPALTLAEFEAHLNDTTAPPGPVDTFLGEIVVHASDIRRPLGIEYTFPAATLIRTADFYKNSNPIVGAKSRVGGLRLVATDADWSHGSGPLVSGPLLSVILAMTGRKVALADLTGDGVAVLTERP